MELIPNVSNRYNVKYTCNRDWLQLIPKAFYDVFRPTVFDLIFEVTTVNSLNLL